MRYALLSDVHAYPPALEKVLADAASQRVDRIMCLGDVVGYGPDPAGAVKLCREACDVVVAGNHDAAVARNINTAFFIQRAKDAVDRHRKLLSKEDVEWLSALPMSVAEGNFMVAHGEFHSYGPVTEAGFGYVLSGGDALDVLRALPPKVDIAFVGHTHAACVWTKSMEDVGWPRLQEPDSFTVKEGCRCVVNIGAVGYPRYHRDTIYVIYDSETRLVEFRHIPFALKEYHSALVDAGIDPPLWLVERLNLDVG